MVKVLFNLEKFQEDLEFGHIFVKMTLNDLELFHKILVATLLLQFN